MTFPNLDEKIDEILDKYAKNYHQLLRFSSIEAKEICERKRGEAKQAIKQLIEEEIEEGIEDGIWHRTIGAE